MYLPVFVLLSTTAMMTAQTAKSRKPVGKFLGSGPPSFVIMKISRNQAPFALPCGNEIVLVLETMEPSPLDTIIVPRVAINAGSPSLETRIPLINPKSEPHRRMTRSTSGMASPFSIKVPPISAQQMATVPIDRSIPPVAMTKVTPMAMKAT